MPNGRRHRKTGRRTRPARLTESPATVPGWPLAVEIVERMDHSDMVRREPAAIGDERLCGLLAAIPLSVRRFMLQELGIGGPRKVTPAMASHLRTLLARGPHSGGTRLLQRVTLPVVTLFDRIGEVAGNWRDFSGADPEAALRVLLAHPEVPACSADVDLSVPAAVYRLGLLAAVGSPGPGSVAALAYLAVDAGEVRAVYAGLRADHPSIPEVPAVGFAQVTVAARLRAAGLSPADRPLEWNAMWHALEAIAENLPPDLIHPPAGGPRGRRPARRNGYERRRGIRVGT